MAMGALFGKDYGNTEAAMLDGILLHHIVGPRRKGGIKPVGDSLLGPWICPESSPEHSAVGLFYELHIFFRYGDLPVLILFIHRPSERTDELAHLFFDRHPGKKVGCAPFRAQARIHIRGRRFFARKESKGRNGGCRCSE